MNRDDTLSVSVNTSSTKGSVTLSAAGSTATDTTTDNHGATVTDTVTNTGVNDSSNVGSHDGQATASTTPLAPQAAAHSVNRVNSVSPPASLADGVFGSRHNAPHAWCNGVALMQAMPPPTGFTAPRWRRACLDAAWLVEMHGAELLALGWTAADVFGLHTTAPGVAVDCYGLALLLDGATVTELTAKGARVVRPTGSTLSMRHGGGRPAVPAWMVGEQGHGTAGSDTGGSR